MKEIPPKNERSPEVQRSLSRAAALLHPGPIPPHLADLIDPRLHVTANDYKDGVQP